MLAPTPRATHQIAQRRHVASAPDIAARAAPAGGQRLGRSAAKGSGATGWRSVRHGVSVTERGRERCVDVLVVRRGAGCPAAGRLGGKVVLDRALRVSGVGQNL